MPKPGISRHQLDHAVDAWINRNIERILAQEWAPDGDREHAPGLVSGVYFVAVQSAMCSDGCADFCMRHMPFVKIGRTRDMELRMHAIRTAQPFDVHTLAMFGAGTNADEVELHKIFACVRHRREWFRLCDPMIRLAETLEYYGGWYALDPFHGGTRPDDLAEAA